MGTFIEKIKEKNIFWLVKRTTRYFVVLLYIPSRFIRKVNAIKAARTAALRPRTAGHVVFVCDTLHIRVIKIGYTLKDAGWRVTLLYKEKLSYDVSDYFSETIQFSNSWDALLIAANYQPIVYHVFSNYNFDIASVLIRYKPGKIVFDNYDLLTGMFKDKDSIPEYTGPEQYCYLNADGICSRDLRIQYLVRELGYMLPPRILFSEYCWPENKFKRSLKLKDGIHLAYVGNMDPDPYSNGAFQYELGDILSKNSIHLHLYPSHDHLRAKLEAVFETFIQDDNARRYIHVYDTISPLNIREEISKYHYGLIISSKSIGYEGHETYNMHVSNYFLAAKVFDYMDAGLVTLSQDARFVRFILERHDKGKIVHTLEDIMRACKDLPTNQTATPLSLVLTSNSERLIKFYEKI